MIKLLSGFRSPRSLHQYVAGYPKQVELPLLILGGTMAVLPERGLPILAQGNHRHAREGVCLIEYVSVLAGEKFSDHPLCTDKLLRYLARMVNDTISSEARSSLAQLAPDLIGTVGADNATANEAARACIAVARRTSCSVPVRWGRLHVLMSRHLSRKRHVGGAVRAVRRLPERQRDEALYCMLAAATAVYHKHHDEDRLVCGNAHQVLPHGRKRPLGIPTVRDRVAHQATKLILDPIFESDICDFFGSQGAQAPAAGSHRPGSGLGDRHRDTARVMANPVPQIGVDAPQQKADDHGGDGD